MAYSDFDLEQVTTDFGLTTEEATALYPDAAPVVAGEYLSRLLAEHTPVALGVNSEKARSEGLIFPVLTDARWSARSGVTVLPGVTFDVDRPRGLNGLCDYLVTRSPELYFVRGPIIAVVEGKREDIREGLGQCAATMVGVRLFNEKKGTARPVVHGCVTTGTAWRFLQLRGDTLLIDRDEFPIQMVDRILGILVHIFTS